jgi:hypothetical protein
MAKHREKPKENAPATRHRGYVWSRVMEAFQSSHHNTTFYLDLVERRVVSLRQPSERDNEMVKAEQEYLKARLEAAPESLARIPCYSYEDEEGDWVEFLLRFPDAQYRRKLHQARREFNGGSRDLLNRLVEDYPGEEAQWNDYREKRMEQRLESWLQSVGVKL